MSESLASLYGEVLLAERELCKKYLWAHIEIACGKTFDPVVHGDIIQAFQDWADGRLSLAELICMLPRGHFKTTLFACILTWLIARDRNITSCIVGAVHSTGADTVYIIRELLESEEMVRIYGPFKGDSVWNNEELIVCGRTERMRESTVKAMGVESFKPGGHFNIVWFDDPEDQDTVNTDALRQKTRTVYALSRPMADKPGAMRWITGTFWDDGDLYCHLIEQYGLGKIDPVEGRLVCENGKRSKDGKKLLFFKPAEDEEGNPLFPARFSRETLAEIREEMEFQSPGSYDKQYGLNPVTNKSSRFRPQDYQTADSAPREYEVWFGMDFAQSKTEGSDRSAVVGCFATPEYRFYVFEATEIALDAELQQDAIFERYASFPSVRFSVEADNFVKGWKPQFEARCRQMGVFPMIEWIDAGNRNKKDDRIFGTEGLFRAKQVFFLPGTTVLWSQLKRMPASRRKDVADAWANIVEKVVPSLNPSSTEEKKVRGFFKLLVANDEGTNHGNTPYASVEGSEVPWPAS